MPTRSSIHSFKTSNFRTDRSAAAGSPQTSPQVVPPKPPTPPPKPQPPAPEPALSPTLLGRLRQELTLRHYSRATIRAYVGIVEGGRAGWAKPIPEPPMPA